MPLTGRSGVQSDFAPTNALLTSIETNTDPNNTRASMGWTIEGRAGLVPGITFASILGRNPNADNSVNRVLFPYNPTDDPPDVTEIASARILSFASSSTDDDVAGIGALTMLVTGLDSNFDVQSETITLTGQTEVDSVNSYKAVNQMIILSTGSATWNVGHIYCSDSTDTFTGGVPNTRNYFTMETEWNIAFTSIFTVPRNHLLIPLKYSSITNGTPSKFALSQVDARLGTGLPIFRVNEFTNSGIDFNYDLVALNTIAEEGMWIVRSESSTAQLVQVLVYTQYALLDLAVYNV